MLFLIPQLKKRVAHPEQLSDIDSTTARPTLGYLPSIKSSNIGRSNEAHTA